MSFKNDKRTRILRAAVKVFAQKGFYNAKVAEIAKGAGVADGTIYLYFKGKDEILISIFEEEMAKFIAKAHAQIESASQIDHKLRAFIHTHLDFVKNNPKLAQVFQLELRQSNKFIKEYTGSKLKEYLNLIGELISEGQRQGVIRADIHPGLAKRAIFGALDEVATQWVLLKRNKYDLRQSADQIADMFLRGVTNNQTSMKGGASP
ncbi:TetR/AcrR family transcriptional regulator [candidate division KSB1 bacterium]|nr:TetR/AcrR family transcriptional regulator [candidate division KSB1 bacterium]NIR70271.1 TetR/AcrR family transcriptional regulator [candidate division KSB1 bacterium]NIS26541.1 TetR/AcrR family transcriptional regulator [candidate division KSB1 bacterium]NIT73304.1 TetR/AcrR family transcriptional regulator [candidate division KSB1 bacterium]NIU23927.1 TetR/AcrR family transcriptional regulator [candidate division KSB1 bacterium]